MRKPWPRIHTDFHGSFFLHCRRGGGGTGDAVRNSATNRPRPRSHGDSAGAGPRAKIRGSLQLSAREEPRRQQSRRRNIARPFCRETTRAQEPRARCPILIPPRPLLTLLRKSLPEIRARV